VPGGPDRHVDVAVTTVAPPRLSTPMVVVAATVLAAASLLITDSLRFDPGGWLLWGRQIALGEGAFDTSGLPSWKPLPLLATVPLAFTGSAAPWLWLLVVRTAGLLALVAVYRLTARQADGAAGAVAAGLLALAPGWWPTVLGGGIEPIVVGLGCAAIAADRVGRRGLAIALLGAMALGREEAVILLFAYGVWLCVADRRWLVPVALAVAVVVGAWLGGDWLGSGDALRGGALAREASALPVQFHGVALVAALVVGPIAAVLWISGVVGSWRAGEHVMLAIAAAGVAWAAVDIALAIAGYPLPPRFLLPAAAAAAVVAGVGAVVLRERLR
jgi:hypothetical protein